MPSARDAQDPLDTVLTGVDTEVRVTVGGRTLSLTNLDKPLFPDGTTKAHVITYFLQVAETILPHLDGKAITRLRFPNGTGQASFYEKNAPAGAPDWVRTMRVDASDVPIDYVIADDTATLVWLANLAAIELHVPQWRARNVPRHLPQRPIELTGPDAPLADSVVIDLDPGPSVTMVDTCVAALMVANELAGDGLIPFVKTTGSKGLQVYSPLEPTRWEECVTYVRQLANRLTARHPDRFINVMAKDQRGGRVFVDYLQNQSARNTVAPYSLRGRERPWVSMPVTWDEIAAVRSPDSLRFGPTEALQRIAEHGDLFAGLLDPAYAISLPDNAVD